MTKQPSTVRAAIKAAIRLNRIAKDTSNSELYTSTRQYIRTLYRSRNSSVVVPFMYFAEPKKG